MTIKKVKTIEGAFKDKIETDWRTLLKDGHSYLIHEVPDPEYVAVITGGIGEGNQYDYHAEKNRSVRFRILKQPVHLYRRAALIRKVKKRKESI